MHTPRLASPIPWTLNTRYCHNGIPLSNGVFGALVWFAPGEIRITINRGDYWDHRGDARWTEDLSYQSVRRLAEAGDVDSLQRLFQSGAVGAESDNPTRLPLGRIEIPLVDGAVPLGAELDLFAGEARVILGRDGEAAGELRASVYLDDPAVVVAVSGGLTSPARLVPAADFPAVGDAFAKRGIPPYQTVSNVEAVDRDGGSDVAYRLSGFVQALPADPAMAVLTGASGADQPDAVLVVAADRDKDAVAATVRRRLLETARQGYRGSTDATRAFWADRMARTAAVSLPDPGMERLYALGIYKMLGNSMPGGIAPSLQGPWVEEHRMPPWSSDFHFNINVEECLWAAFGSGHWDALGPLFETVERWMPVLRERARKFVGVLDGVHLPHAVDDRGMMMGNFWTGAIDPGNAAWVGQLMWLYYRYTGDTAFLEQRAVPFLAAAFRVFRAMMEDRDGELCIPVSVSPEYGADGNRAWGVNASYALAHAHFLAETLLRCRDILPHHPVSRDDSLFAAVSDTRARLPMFSVASATGDEHIAGNEILIWDGQFLEHSHRHHSHLVGVYPLDIVDPDDPELWEIVGTSYRRWVQRGMGEWSGWSLPWASILHGRLGSAEMAWLSLTLFGTIFTMPGFGTRHNSNADGLTVLSGGDVMQLDGAIGYAAAILELFVQEVRGQIRVFAGVPDSVASCSFAGIRAQGGFTLSGRRMAGMNQWVRVISHRGETLSMQSPWPEGCRLVVEPEPLADPMDAPDVTGAHVLLSVGDGADDTAPKPAPGITVATEPGRSYVVVPHDAVQRAAGATGGNQDGR